MTSDVLHPASIDGRQLMEWLGVAGVQLTAGLLEMLSAWLTHRGEALGPTPAR